MKTEATIDIIEQMKQTNSSLAWEVIECQNEIHITTYIRRSELPSGWLVENVYDRIYRSTAANKQDGLGTGCGMTFVPDPNKDWQPKIIFKIPATIENK